MTNSFETATERHARACESLKEVARNSFFESEAQGLAIRLFGLGRNAEAEREIEAALRKIYRMTKDGRLG